jgi:hypothetical protein
MLFHNRYRAQGLVCRAPFDAARGAVGAPNQGAVKQGSKAHRDALLDSNGKSTSGSSFSSQNQDNEKLGKSRKTSAFGDRTGAARTLDRYRLQRHGAKILGFPKSVSACQYARQFRVKDVEVWRNTSDDRTWSQYKGVQTCKLLWICPICSNRRAWERRGHLLKLIEYTQAEGLTLVMLTLTSSHDLGTSLLGQRLMMKKAKGLLTGRGPFKKGLLRHMTGSVTATEVTHGARSGWHLHFHYIVVLNLRHIPVSEREEEARRLGEMAWPAWEGAATNVGLHVSRKAFSVDVGEAVAQYPADGEKVEGGWTLADEATRGAVKSGSGRHPFELLRLSCDEGDASARELFIEYSDSMHNVRAMTWSKGLAARVGIKKAKDGKGEDEVLEKEDPVKRDLAGKLDQHEWQGFGTGTRAGVRMRRGRMLVAVTKHGSEGFEQERDNDKTDPSAADQGAVLNELGIGRSFDDATVIDPADRHGHEWSEGGTGILSLVPHQPAIAPKDDVPKGTEPPPDTKCVSLHLPHEPRPGGLAAVAIAAVRKPPNNGDPDDCISGDKQNGAGPRACARERLRQSLRQGD